ncbi:MAG: TIGR04165 family Cys-rich peptide [Methanosphaera sp.]|nr:TIGR04165 family Cys-rich peptide [Methanosphaera sp.]
MKIKELMTPCPECGSKDKTQHRDFEKEFKAYGTSGELKCSNCGHIFITRDEAIDNRRAEENKD